MILSAQQFIRRGPPRQGVPPPSGGFRAPFVGTQPGGGGVHFQQQQNFQKHQFQQQQQQNYGGKRPRNGYVNKIYQFYYAL